MLKKILLILLKYALPLAIIGWLLTTIDQQQWDQLTSRPKNWPLLAGSLALVLAAVCTTFVRWYLLVRALDLPFKLRDAFRLGFLCQLLNFVGIGSAGGDLFKAFFIAREQPGRRAAAVSTVIVDRVIGLYALLVVTSFAILMTDVSQTPTAVQAVCNATLILTLIGAIGIGVFLMPGLNASRLIGWLMQIPKAGNVLGQLAVALRAYRDKPAVLLVSGGMSLGVHISLSIAIYMITISLYDAAPTLGDHFIIVPLSLVAGALPLTPAGLGTFEVAFEQLFHALPSFPGGEGIVVALVYRMMTIITAAIGMVYYWSSRSEVSQLLHEAEQQQEATHRDTTPQAAVNA